MGFQLRQIRMCRTFISHLAKENVQIEAFPKSQQVTYRYYLGRYYLFESQVRKVILRQNDEYS
jgi:nuclear mRNA export protein PCID2/THP1